MLNESQRAQLTRWLNTTTWPIPYEARTLTLDLMNRQGLTRMSLGFGNQQIDLDLADCLQSNLFLDKVWEPDLSNWAAYFAARSKCIADVGAQIGYFTLLMASFGRDAAIHAFEPNPETFHRLKNNVALNNLTLTLNSVAVADRAGQAAFQVPHRFQLGSARLQPQRMHGSRSVMVATTTLDAYIAQNSLAGFDLVKMDIEGAEKLAFQGMSNGLRRNQYRVILFEFHRQLLSAGEQTAIFERFETSGYRMYEIARVSLNTEITAKASLVAALSPSALAEFHQPGPDLRLPADFAQPFP
jgi:FkbM family methyltransferase